MIPTFSLFIALAVPQNADSVVARAKEAIKPLVDSAALVKAGYVPLAFGPVRDNTPFQGQHWLTMMRIVTDPPVDLLHPSFVMYLPLGDSLVPVGVAYSRRITSETAVPSGLAGTPADWHTHVFCRGVPGEGTVLADGVDDCKDRGGTPTLQQIAMVHTWTIPNPDGPYAHDNPSLPFVATGLTAPAHPTRDDRLFAVALGESYGAKLPQAHRIDRVAQRGGAAQQLTVYRDSIRALVPQLRDAEKRGDAARVSALRNKAIAGWTALLAVYHALAPTRRSPNASTSSSRRCLAKRRITTGSSRGEQGRTRERAGGTGAGRRKTATLPDLSRASLCCLGRVRLFVDCAPLVRRQRRDRLANRFGNDVVHGLESQARLPDVELLAGLPVCVREFTGDFL